MVYLFCNKIFYHMEFKQPVIEAIGYYVYCLVDPRNNIVFYIGKGKGNRVFAHAKNALNDDNENLKYTTIREIINSGNKVMYYIIRHNLTEETAYIVESTLIDFLTYPKFNNKSILTNIQSGHHIWDEGIKSAKEINMTYDCEKIIVNENENLLLVSLNKSFNQSKSTNVYVRPDIYEATRKYWKADIHKLEKIDYVLGVYKNIVRSVIKPDKWIPTKCSEDGHQFSSVRYECEGELLLDSPYLNKDVSDFPFGSGGAIRYISKVSNK